MKRILALLLSTIMLSFSLTSCGWIFRSVKEECPILLVIEPTEDGEIIQHLGYNNSLYIAHKLPYSAMSVDRLENEIILYEQGSHTYYADSLTAPTYIFSNSNWRQFIRRDDDDFMSDIFLLKGSDFEAPLASYIDFAHLEGPLLSDPVGYYGYEVEVTLTMKSDRNLIFTFYIYDAGGHWAAYLGEYSGEFYTVSLSEEIAAILKKHGYIVYEFIEQEELS